MEIENERRSYPRSLVNSTEVITVSVKNEDDWQEAMIHDMSVSGLGLKFNTNINDLISNLKGKIIIRIQINDKTDEKNMIQIKGKVIWSHYNNLNKSTMVGVDIEDISEDNKEFIKNIIHHLF